MRACGVLRTSSLIANESNYHSVCTINSFLRAAVTSWLPVSDRTIPTSAACSRRHSTCTCNAALRCGTAGNLPNTGNGHKIGLMSHDFPQSPFGLRQACFRFQGHSQARATELRANWSRSYSALAAVATVQEGHAPAQDTEVEPKQYHVLAKSFLLGSYIDLQQLKPRFADVLRAQGKDYLVMGFRPSGAGIPGIATPTAKHSADERILHAAGLAPLSPDDTYFAVFRYGAVVMFQTVDAKQASLEAQHKIQVTAPTYPASGESVNPWDTSPEKWKDAAGKDHDGELIYLLLRPFIDQSSDGILFKKDFLPEVGEDETLYPAERRRFTRPLNESHAHFGNGQRSAQPLMYKESVHLVVCPQQEQFITQKPDVFYINHLDVGVLRCVASALGQSSALDFYSEKVDAALRMSQAANLELMQTGEMRGSMDFKKVIGYCSLIHGAVISQLGLLDKNDLAWQFAKYDKMVEMFRTEFEMEKRIKNLEDKIAVVARDASTFVSFQNSAKSYMMEWLIAGLITAEICVALYDMFFRH